MNRSLITLLVLGLATSALAGDWTRFRGPNGSGISPDPEPVPITWRPQQPYHAAQVAMSG
jgi:hypothetical protein